MLSRQVSSCGLIVAATAAADAAASADACAAATAAAANSRVRRRRRSGSGRLHSGHRRTKPFGASACGDGDGALPPPTAGAAIDLAGAFQTTISDVWIDAVWIGVHAHHMANTITILDSQLSNVHGPSGILAAGGGPELRVDILQIARLTANNPTTPVMSSVVWLDIGAGTNTVRLDNVGLINGGIGVRLDSPADSPAGEAPGRPLFLIANDLEVDFPSSHAIALLHGEDAQLSNCYVQGSLSGSGVMIGPDWNSE